MSVLVGGVGQLFQGDLDLGRVAAERLSGEDLGSGVLVEDLYYGALAVVQRLEELRPGALVLVGAEARGRAPGSVERRRVHAGEVAPLEARHAVEGAGAGEVSIELLARVMRALGALPARTTVIEVEPARTEPGAPLSKEAQEGLEVALDLVRAEARRAPILELADRIAERLGDGRLERTPAVEAMAALLAELEVLDEEGRWGATFQLRDRVRLLIAEGHAGEGMDHLDWGLWWSLIEGLDRLQGIESGVED